MPFLWLPQTRTRPPLTQTFWEQIRQVSNNVSTLTETTTGTRVDYFAILKERLDTFVQQMQENANENTDPTSAMGPVFAKACNAPDDPLVILCGTIDVRFDTWRC